MPEEVVMFNPTATMIHHCVKRLQAGYRHTYGNTKPAYAELIGEVATVALQAIAHSDALYHNIEHTMLVALVGQEILRGKQLQKNNVSCQDWAQFMIALLCHDVGYVKGVCSEDNGEQRTFTTGIGDEKITIAVGATDASLTPYHVDRSKLFVQETLTAQPLLDLAVIQQYIELTRFPVPNDELHQDTIGYAGLARAADLIGQLSDPRYLEKIPALFYEFEEVGTNRALGYHHPGDLRAGYPKFFRNVVHPYIRPALQHLKATHKGRLITNSLYAHVLMVEQELSASEQACLHIPRDPFFQTLNRVFQGNREVAVGGYLAECS
jgi:hypothetical protein